MRQDLFDHLGLFDEREKNAGHDANSHDRERVMLLDLMVGRMTLTPLFDSSQTWNFLR
ncbi:MAG: hypothetical protein NTW68_04615 [candidate division NC10 bacterium]|nr:hypothetical protein [candidate division NC10 bacterium]